jgi:hypothetical protein
MTTIKLANILTLQECKEIEESLKSIENKNIEKGGFCANSVGYYNAPETLKYVDRFESLIKSTGVNIAFENTYTRSYKVGSFLKIHTDRKNLDFTISLCIKKDVNWPLNISSKRIYIPDNESGGWNPILEPDYWAKDFVAFDNDPGDAVLAEGRKYPHWREQIECNDDQENIYAFYHWRQIK